MAKLLEFLDRHTARNLFRSSHLKNEEYTLCLACLGYHASRTKNMHCVKRVWAITL